MQIKTESISNTQKRLEIQVSTSSLVDEVNKKLNDIKKTAKIDGFRPGKVPMSRLREQYGMGAQQEAINELINTSVFDAIDQEKLNIIASPAIEDVKLEEETLSFTATVEIFPIVEVTGFDKVTATRKITSVSDEDVETMIESLRQQRQTFVEKEGAIVSGDQATFDFEGSIAGELFEGGAATDFSLIIGSNRMIAGFEDGLVGVSAGEEKIIDVTFPEDYQSEELQGKEAQFKLNVSKVETAVLPEIDEEFLKIFNITDGGPEKLTAEVRKNMEREVKNASRSQIKSAVFDALVAQNEVEVPEVMLKNEIERQRNKMVERLSQQFGGDAGVIDESMLPDDLFTEQAKKSATLGIVISSLIEQNEIKVSADKVTAYIAEVAQNYEDPTEVIEHYTTDEQQKSQVESIVLEDQIVDFIIEKITVTEEAVSYQDLLAEAQQLQQQM